MPKLDLLNGKCEGVWEETGALGHSLPMMIYFMRMGGLSSYSKAAHMDAAASQIWAQVRVSQPLPLGALSEEKRREGIGEVLAVLGTLRSRTSILSFGLNLTILHCHNNQTLTTEAPPQSQADSKLII